MKRTVTLTAALIPVVLLALLAWSAQKRDFNADEFQHVEMAWLIAIGQVPYRDFFEHHTPLYHFMIAPLLSDPKLATDGATAVHSLIILRWLSVMLSGGMVVLTGYIGTSLAGPRVGVAAAIALASSTMFASKGLEIRPDQLGSCAVLAATLALATARERPGLWRFACAGAAAMLAIMTTQKLALAVPGLGIIFLFAARKRMLISAFAVIGGALSALVPLFAWYMMQGALSVFIKDNFLLGATWPRDMWPLFHTLIALARDDILLLLFAALGCASVFRAGWRSAAWPLAVLSPGLAMAVMMPTFPVVQPQYVFLILPYAALAAGIGAVAMLEAWTPETRVPALATLLCAFAAHGTLSIWLLHQHRDTVTLDKLRYAVEQTPVDATVLRSWSTGLAFRRPAFFYFSLHSEIRAVVPEHDWKTLEDGLRSGRVAPELIEMSSDTRALPPGVLHQLESGWAPTGIGDLWRRKAR